MARISIRTALFTSASFAAIVVGSGQAQAGGFAVREQSAYFQGTSFAGNAAGGPAISSMFWNPATITQAGLGLTMEKDGSYIIPQSRITPSVATTGTGANILGLGESREMGTNALAPSSYLVYGLSDRIWLGLGLNAPFGLNTKPGPLWAGMFYSRESDVFGLNFNPNVAVKVTDWLSVGVGAQAQYLKVKLESAFPGSGTFPPFGPLLPDTLHVKGQSWDLGFTAGVTITPTKWTTIGIGYRSQIDSTLRGGVERPLFVSPPVVVPAAKLIFNADVPLPDIVTASIRQKITETFTAMATVEWTNWSRFTTVPVSLEAPVAPPGIPTALPFEWQDGWFFSVGAEYQLSPKMSLRAGVAYEISPITDEVRATRLPDNDRIWLSVGATYNWTERLALELAYSHIFVDDAPINLVPGNPTFNPVLGTFVGVGHAQVDIISIALRYRFGPTAAPVAPLITKG
jgi:long-chain fatty acid transport protein